MKTTSDTINRGLVFLFYQIDTMITSHAKRIARVLKRFTSLLFHSCKTAVIVSLRLKDLLFLSSKMNKIDRDCLYWQFFQLFAP